MTLNREKILQHLAEYRENPPPEYSVEQAEGLVRLLTPKPTK